MALKGSAEEKALVQRYTGELNKQETGWPAIHTELGDLQQMRNEAAAELDRIVRRALSTRGSEVLLHHSGPPFRTSKGVRV